MEIKETKLCIHSHNKQECADKKMLMLLNDKSKSASLLNK